MLDDTLRILEPHGHRPFQLSEVERALRDLWKEASSEAPAGGAILRACVVNLIVWEEGGRGELEALVTEVSRDTPGRVFLLLIDPGAPDGVIGSEVSAVCHLRRGGGHICGEQVTLTSAPGSTKLLPSAVQSLILGDLPITLWCRHGLPVDQEPFRRLSSMADQLIFDGATLPEGAALRPALVAAAQRLARKRATTDLAWARLHPWREQLAGCFEPLERRALLPAIRRIEVTGGDGRPSLDALYLAAWASARLGWRQPRRDEGNGPSWCFDLPEQPGVITFAPGGGASPVERLQLTAGSIRIDVQLDGAYLHVGLEPPGAAPAPPALSATPAPTATLLSQEVDGRFFDAHYAQTVDTTIALLDTLEPDGQ